MIDPVRPTTLSDQVFRAVEQRIQSGEFGPGDQLPTEKQLAKAFAVSRAVVREAISRLKADGYVATRQGVGAYVSTRPGGASFRFQRDGGLDAPAMRQIFELRLLLEVGAAELAARRRTDDDLRIMQVQLDRMSIALERSAEASTEDDAFHCAIAAATHNPYVRRFMEFLGHQLSDSRRPTWSDEGHAEGRARAAQREHERLFEAIVSRDAIAARRAAAEHLLKAAERLGLQPIGEEGLISPAAEGEDDTRS